MTVQERILALKLLERLDRNPEYAKRMGVGVEMRKKHPKEENHV